MCRMDRESFKVQLMVHLMRGPPRRFRGTMATQLSTMTQWQKTLALDRREVLSPIVYRQLSFPRVPQQPPPVLRRLPPPVAEINSKSVQEARKVFLKSLHEGTEAGGDVEGVGQRRMAGKKISFKIKKSGSVHRRPKMAAISASTVAELTSKFNEIAQMDAPKVSRKHSVKMKTRADEEAKAVQRRKLVRKVSDSECVRAKICYLDTPQVVLRSEETKPQRPSSIPLTVKEEMQPISVKATVEKFERQNSETSPLTETPKSVPKPKVPEKNFTLTSKEVKIKHTNTVIRKFEKTSTVNTELVQTPEPHRRCDSLYEPLSIPVTPILKAKSAEVISETSLVQTNIRPNHSFLWRGSREKVVTDDPSNIYEAVNPPLIPPRTINLQTHAKGKEVITKQKMPLPPETEEKIYEELHVRKQEIYEEIGKSSDDGYEYMSPENVYETVPATAPQLPARRKDEPLPPRPPSTTSWSQTDRVSNCYESIYTKKETETDSTYEVVYGGRIKSGSWSSGSNRDSLLSSDQQSNSLYGRSLGGWGDDPGNPYVGKATSDLSSSDRSDEWQDLSESEANEKEEGNPGIVIIMEKQDKRNKKTGWSQILREQRNKIMKTNTETTTTTTTTDIESDHDHHYETLSAHEESQDDDFDSFESDTESEKFEKNDSGVDVMNTQLPEPPNNQTYVLTRLAARANKHMKRLRNTWSVNDFTKSLGRMRKKKSGSEPDFVGKSKEDDDQSTHKSHQATPYENVNLRHPEKRDRTDSNAADKSKPGNPKGFLHKFRKSITLSAESANELTQNLTKTKSTFYLTETIDIDGDEKTEDTSKNDSGLSSPPIEKRTRKSSGLIRPVSPPPPVPIQSNTELRKSTKRERLTSWYTEIGLFKNQDRTPNTFWYAEVGLYPRTSSTPSTSSPENSGSNTTNAITDEEYHNMKNKHESTEKTINWSFPVVAEDLQLRLQDEPLYQFYDAAVLESVCQDSISDFDSDGYDDVDENGKRANYRMSLRPSAMEIVAPYRNSLAISRTLWCEIPEVISSSVLSSLSLEQKKLQEAKFEMLTSEASYLNSLNVLTDHFISNLQHCDIITTAEKTMLFGEIAAVKECSERLLLDLEKCWQDNILLSGVCEIIQKHAEEKFHVYITYCENQIHLDSTLKKIKERPGFGDILRFLENSSTCQSLTLYSFLMLPMQRITRWPLLVDAVLKRLSSSDGEFVTCQRALATLNRVVTQCNEGARKTERRVEIQKISSQLEYPKDVAEIKLESEARWLVRSGALTHMTLRTDETILTFGKRFIKVPLYLFLFNDMLLVTRLKSDDCYTVLHYCPRNLVELTFDDSFKTLPVRDSQGKHLLFVTILENQEGKTVEFLFSASSESDKERWIEALSPPKSEDPDEVLYECWDCPQVIAVHNYVANQPDELSLNKGDNINVTRKMADGWYNGERIRDGQMGWFPANYTKEVANPHVKARNLRQRYRLLALSENYLKSK